MVCVGGKYQLLGKLGSGGTSSVYLAVDNVLHKKWAVKETSNENLDSDKKALILVFLESLIFLRKMAERTQFATMLREVR